jgi:uncharacterized protein (DUF58 family)
VTYLPTPRLFALAVPVALLLAAGQWLPWLVGAAVLYAVGLGVVAALDARATPSAGDFEVARRHDARLSIGEPNPIVLTVRRRGGDRVLPLRVRDEPPAGLAPEEPLFAGEIAPGGEWSGTYQLKPLRRGEYPFGALNLRIGSPRGLLVRQHRYPIGGTAFVYPNLRAVRRYVLEVRRGRAIEAGQRRVRWFGRGTELERLREYVPDDDFRRIAWKPTARRGRPIVVEHEVERTQNLMLVLDVGRLMAAPVGGMQKLDYAANASLMLAYVATELGDRVGLLSFADRVESYVPPGRGRRQFQLLLSSLYRVGTRPVEADVGKAVAYLAARNPKRSLVVLFTDLSEAGDERALVGQLRVVARHHLLVCLTMDNPDLRALASSVPDDLQAAYERIVAQGVLDDRRVAVERLERIGAAVGDVPADRLTPETVDRYLRIKARTQL